MSSEIHLLEEQPNEVSGFPENATYENYIAGQAPQHPQTMSTSDKLDLISKLKIQNEKVKTQFLALAEQIEALT